MPVTIYLAGLQEPFLPAAGPSSDVIKDAGFLRGASEEMLQAAAGLLVPVAAAAYEWIVTPQMPAQGLYILAAGTVELFGADGEYLLTICGSGNFGEDSLFRNQSVIGAARASTSARLWLFDRLALSRLQPHTREQDDRQKKDLLLWI